MTDEERFDRLATAIERVAEASTTGIQQLTQTQLVSQQQIGILTESLIKVQQRQAEQDQRFDVLLGEIRYLARRVNGEGSQS
ncbi:MAG: hypothetical protein HC924_14310 [Synechococcaceae cyanobacterium SM2_3_2]|nr:hypothetical protein [Synechococcaceae cyanobacterium SM2_3_2]